MSKPLRTVMPKVTAFIDALRADPSLPGNRSTPPSAPASMASKRSGPAKEASMSARAMWSIRPRKSASPTCR